MTLRLEVLSCIFLLYTFECSAVDILKVDNIYVSEKTGDQIDSKSIAIINGTNIALKKLMSTLNASKTNQSQHMKCIDETEETSKLLASYSINSERITSQSYSAYIDFFFNQKEVESLMNKCGFDYASVSPGKTLLVPLIKVSSGYRIVDKELDTKIFTTINTLPTNTGLLDIKTIYDMDIPTIANLDFNILMNGSYKEIMTILNKYNSETLLLIGLNSLSDEKLSLSMRFISRNEEYKDTQEYLAKPGEKISALLKRAYNTLIHNMDLNWKRGFIAIGQKVYHSSVLIELTDPGEWNKLNNILRQIDSIKGYKFKSIGHDSVEIDMQYIGSPEELSNILRQYNIAVFKRHNQTIMKFIN